MTVKELLTSNIYVDSELISIRIDLNSYSFFFRCNLVDYWGYRDGISVWRGSRRVLTRTHLENEV